MGARAFTTKFNGLSSRLISKDAYIQSFGKISRELIVQWDTGATGTCISKELAHEMGLIPTGKEIINTPAGQSIRNTYLIDLLLPNKVAIRDFKIVDAEIGNQGIDVLIGMDIITHGDFSVSNYNQKTFFTFRIPSQDHCDFCKEESLKRIIGTKHGKGNRKKK